MDKYEHTVQLVLMQLAMNREGIEHGHLELMTVEVKYRPHGGLARSAQVKCLNVYDGSPQGEPARAPATNGAKA